MSQIKTFHTQVSTCTIIKMEVQDIDVSKKSQKVLVEFFDTWVH